jgi:hypothetical protein
VESRGRERGKRWSAHGPIIASGAIATRMF